MRAVQIQRLDGPRALDVVDVADPEAAAGEVRIEVHAAGVTFPDVLMSRGGYQMKPELPFVPGSEVAGVVESAPEDSGFAVGDRVAAFCGLGGFAEHVVARADAVFHLPDSVSMAAGAAYPMNYLTVHFGLLRRGRLRAGETVLVHGAAGGVGTAATQLAVAVGARVIAVVSTEDKVAVARQAGASEVVLAAGFLARVKELTGGVDVVVDPVGGGRFTDSLRSLRPEGRILVIGFTEGEIPTVKVNRLLLNNVDVVGVGWGAFALTHPGYLQEQWAELEPLAAAGRLDPPIGSRFPLERAGEALDELDQRRAAGKVLLDIRQE